jgi:hypothetical protein
MRSMAQPSGPRCLCLGGLLGLASLGAAPAVRQAPWPGRADYRIEAELDGATKRLDGWESLRWTNRTEVETGELWFHLYLNAFANNRSTHMRESGGRLRGREIEEGWGWIRITSLRVRGEEHLAGLRFRAPDDGNPDDRTVASVELREPVRPGETVEIEVMWESQLPRVRRRTGYKGDFLLVAQWFPKLGVFEGRRGWNCHQFHATTEFYSNYGTYDVTLDLPAEYEKRVGASGVLVEPPKRLGDRTVARFVAPSPASQTRPDSTGKLPLVHDFTWAADPDFKPRYDYFQYDVWKERFPHEVSFAQLALGAQKDLRLPNVEVVLMMQPERESQWRRHFEATCTALFFYGLWFGPYPYEQITVIDPAWGAGAAGGMEYPMLFTAGSRLFTTEDMYTPESVTVHEAGHQWWYGLVGNNEFEAAWLDEGFNSFADSEALVRRYGPRREVTWYSGLPLGGVLPAPEPGGAGTLSDILSARRIPLPLLPFDLQPLRASGWLDMWRDQPWLTLVPQSTDPRWSDRVGYLRDPERDPIDTFAYRYVDAASYGTNSYPRTAVALRSLAGVIGYEKLLAGLRHYSETWRYGHPYPDDFFRTFIEGAGVDVAWYFDEVFRGTGGVDWGVKVDQRREAPPRGVFQTEDNAAFAELDGSPPAREGEPIPSGEPPPEDESARAHDGGDPASAATGEDEERPWIADVLVVRRGELRLPLLIELRFEDGASERRTWSREEQAQGRWLRIVHRGEAKLVSVLLDPERSYQLDSDLSNNRWYDATDDVAPLRWTERAFNRYLHLLHWQAGLGG